MDLNSVAPYAALAVALVVFLLIDLRFFARGREPSFREGAWWSLGWLAISLAAALIVWWFDDGDAAVLYTTVYLIERSLSLDNLFVFILLFAYFGVPYELRARLLFWGIVFALVLRGLAIGGGIALIEQFHFVIYVLGVLLLVARLPGLARRRGERRPRPEPDGAAGPARLPGQRRLPRAPLVRHGGRRPLRDAAVPVPRGDRLRRHRVRDRLDPGGVRDHA